MKKKKALRALAAACAAAAILSAAGPALSGAGEKQGDFIKWMSFDIPYRAMKKAMDVDIRTHGTEYPADWIELLAYLAAKYWGDWGRYRAADLDRLALAIGGGESIPPLAEGMKNYEFYKEAYHAVLAGFVGSHVVTAPSTDGASGTAVYGLKAFSPIAKGYWYAHYDDFGNRRSYGFSRPHLGNDLLGSVGTPIVAVESGRIEALGWNRYGGWRIGIRSFDGMRYYYYAHLRQNWPYVKSLKVGQSVRAGDVIGYMGRTGYSSSENVNNIKTPHLHFGLQIIFDESQKEGLSEIWIDVYDIVRLLDANKSAVRKDAETGEHVRVNDFYEPPRGTF